MKPRADTAAASASPVQFVSVASKQHAITRLNPACLLMVGDVISFAKTLTAPDNEAASGASSKDNDEDGGGGGGSGYEGDAAAARTQRGAAPSMAEQMALDKQLTERVPQRYCIQNHLGVRLWYWAPGQRSPPRHELAAAASQQLRCRPPLADIVMEQDASVKARCQLIKCLMVWLLRLPVEGKQAQWSDQLALPECCTLLLAHCKG
jgi:hypothetical protein